MPEMDIQYTPVPCICSGVISSIIPGTETHEVVIYNSPIGELSGPVYATLIYNPGSKENFKKGDSVKVIIMFSFGGVERRFTDVYPGSDNYIIGRFTEKSIANIKLDTKLTQPDGDRVRWVNERSGSGFVATDGGDAIMASGGSIYHMLIYSGFGINKNSSRVMAQNHWRFVSHNPPFYFAREHFGMFSGSDETDETARVTDEDHSVIYRRFVTQSRSPDNWVSTCEGTFAPWVGANMESDEVEPGKDVLFTKIINYDTKRATIEVGEPGDSFINIRVDDVTVGEINTPGGSGASTGVVGNRFKLKISDKGAMDFRAAGKGIPSANFNGVNIKISESGELTINAKGAIKLSHGDNDESINSIVMDPNRGIDITAKNGFRVNGQALVAESFIDWMNTYQTNLCQVTSIGGPAPIHPAALPDFIAKRQLFTSQGGFTTNETGSPATGLIKDQDVFMTV